MTDRITAYINNTTLAPSNSVLSLTTPRRIVTWQDTAGPVNITGATPVAYAARGERQVELQATILDAASGEVLVTWDAGTLTAGNWSIEHRLTLGGVVSGVRWLDNVVASFFVPPTGEPVVTAAGTITLTGTGPVTATFAAPTYTGTEPITVTLAATLDGSALSVAGGTATIAKTAAAQTVAAVWTLNGAVGDPVVTEAVTATVAAYEVPTASLAPTLTPTGATTMTATLAPDEADGGTALTDRSLVITVNGTPIASVTGLAAEDTHTITGLSEGDTVVARVDVTNAAGTTAGATATAQTWLLPDQMAALTITGGSGQITVAATAAANLNGRPLNVNGYRYEFRDAGGTVFLTVNRPDTTEFTETGLAAQAGVTVTVHARTDAGAGPVSPNSNAVTVAGAISAVGTTGWTATYPSPPAVLTPLTFVASGAGFADDGTSATNTREITATTRTRLAGGTTLTTDDVALSGWVYDGDTIPAATNGSTRPYPLPQVMWTCKEWERVEGTTLKCSVFVHHEFGRNGRPVACVEFTVTDGTTTTAPVRVSDMVLVSNARSGVPYVEYTATVNVSGLADGILTRNAVIKPWIGPDFDIAADGATYPSMTWVTVSKAWKGDIAYFAYVDSAASGGTVATDLATAKTTPFPNVVDATAALNTANGTVSTCEIVLKEGQTHAVGDNGGNTFGDIPLRIVREDTGGTKPIVTRTASNTFIGKRQYWQGVTFQQTDLMPVFWRINTTGAEEYQVWDDCDFDANGHSVIRYFNDLGRGFMYDCSCNFPSGGAGADRGEIVSINTVGTIGWGAQIIVNAIGFDNSATDGGFTLRDAAGSGDYTPNVGSVYAYGKCTSADGVSNFNMDTYCPGNEGYCVVMVEGEETGAVDSNNIEWHGAAPTIDNFPRTIDAGYIYGCSFVGGNSNGPRDNKEGVSDPAFRFDWKLDIAATIWRSNMAPADSGGASGYTDDATRDRNFAQRYRTGWNDVMWYFNRFAIGLGYASEWGEIVGLNNTAFTTQAVAFVDDRSISGTNAGGGDYRVVDDSAGANLIANVPRIPPSRVRLPYDLDGNLIPLDGTALAGAHTVPVPA